MIRVKAPSTAEAATEAPPGMRRALVGQPTHTDLQALSSRSSARREAVTASIEQRRHRSLESLQPAADAALRAQDPIVDAVEGAGGQVLERDALAGTITATVARRRLPALSRRADVEAITVAPEGKPLYLSQSTHAVGAPAFWAAGFLGGGGINDESGPDLALIGDRMYQNHPAFAGIRFQTPEWATGLCSPTILECAHGTQVAGMAFSRGVAGTSTPSDADQKGIAPGVHTVLDAELDYWASGAWLVGLDQSGGDGEHGSQPGAADPAEVVNASYGSRATEDDTMGARGYDYFATGFGLTSTISAGNGGPAGETLSSPCIAYDSICVGAFKIWGSNDWRIPPFSSRGPTVGGRKKPDLVASGAGDTANPNWNNDGKLWDYVEGTSFAAPQVAGAATLLAGSGVTHHLAHKAVLINSARQGRETPTDAMGTQSYWQPDWGWGALDLTAALEQRPAVVPSTAINPGTPGHHAVTEITEGDVHFYAATSQAAGDRATLVWDRRAVGCTRIGCPEGSSAMTLTNLNLYETSSTGATIRRTSDSTIDNVEQVRSPGAASGIYKVKAASTIEGASSEPYSLAARRPITRLAAPRPKVRLTSTKAETRPGDAVTLTATITNPSPDLAADDVTATLELPAGAHLVAGTATRTIGSLSANGTSSHQWTVRFAGDGSHAVRVAVAASALSEPLPSAASSRVLVDGTAPTPSISAPAGARADSNLPISWTAGDSGVGVASYDVEASINNGPFTSWLTGATVTAASYTGQVGASYRFRSRARDRLGNLSAWSTGPLTTVTIPPLLPPASIPNPAPQPTPEPSVTVRSNVRIAKSKLSTGRLTASGTLARRATGRVTVTLSARAHGRTRSAKVTRSVSRGRWAATLKLRGALRSVLSGKLTVSYAGDSGHRRASATKPVRRTRR